MTHSLNSLWSGMYVAFILPLSCLAPKDQEHQRANGNLKYFEYQLAKQQKAEAESGVKKNSSGRVKRRQAVDHLPERHKYEELCRGEGLKLVRWATFGKSQHK